MPWLELRKRWRAGPFACALCRMTEALHREPIFSQMSKDSPGGAKSV